MCQHVERTSSARQITPILRNCMLALLIANAIPRQLQSSVGMVFAKNEKKLLIEIKWK